MGKTSKIDLARSARITPLLAVDRTVIPMEPRVMLDANLEWDLNSTTAIVSVMSGVAEVFESTFADVTSFLEEFEASIAGAMNAIETVVDASESIGGPDLSLATETADRIKQAIALMKDGAIGDISAKLGATGFMDAVAANYATEMAAFAGADAITSAEVSGLLTIGAFTSGTVNSDIDAFLAGKAAGTGGGAADKRDAFDQAVATALNLPSGNFAFELKDIDGSLRASDDAAFDASDILLSFADAGSGDVEVSVNLPKAIADFTRMLTDAIPGAVLPFDLAAVNGTAPALTFDVITGTDFAADGNADTLDELSIDITGFEFAELLSVGGPVALPANAGFNLGFLALDVLSVETARFSLEVDGAADINLGGAITLTGTPGLEWYGDDVFTAGGALSGVGVQGKIQEIGAGAAVDIVADTAYDLLEVKTEGELSFGTLAAQGFEIDLTVASVLDTATAAGRIGAFLDAIDPTLDLRLTDGTLSQAAVDALTGALESLVAIGPDEMIGFLNELGAAVRATLADELVNIDIPLTDLSLGSLTDRISNLFDDLKDSFQISPQALGFSGVAAAEGSGALLLSGEIDSQSGEELNTAQIDALQGFASLDLAVFEADLNTGVELAPLTLTGTDVVNAALSAQDRLQALADALTTALSGYDIAVTVGAGLSLVATATQLPSGSYNSFAVIGAKRTDTTEDDGFDLGSLGFDVGALTDRVVGDVADVASFNAAFVNVTEAVSSLDLGAMATDALETAQAIRFAISVDGVDQFIDVVQGANDWSTLAGVTASFNAALALKGLDVTVGTNAAGNGLSFTLGDEARQIIFDQASSQLLRALDVEGLIAWVNTELQSVLPGAELALAEDGALIFSFPDLEAVVAFGSDPDTGEPTNNLSTDALGLDNIANLSLSANLAGSLEAVLNTGVGIDLAGLAGDVKGAASGILDGSKALGGELIDTLLGNVFLNEIALEAEVSATASEITGTADLGLLALRIGADDPSLNFAAVNGQFEANLVGSGDAAERITLQQLKDAVFSKLVRDANGDPVMVSEEVPVRDANGDIVEDANGDIVTQVVQRAQIAEAEGLGSLLGRLELQGGIVVDGDGQGVQANGDAAETLAQVQIVDAGAAAPGTDLAQMLIGLGDIKVDVVGIDGINEGIVEGVSISIEDLSKARDTAEVALLASDPAALESLRALTNLGDADLLDTLTAVANMLSTVGDTLSDKLPFLANDIPLINVSILDQVDFARDFLESLQELRADPQAGLDTVKAKLEEVFGAGTVTLEWTGEGDGGKPPQTIIFGLSFELLGDYAKSLPFNIDLVEILGDAIGDELGGLTDFVSGLVDATGDGELVFDPLLSMDFVFGLDLEPTLRTPTVLVAGGTELTAGTTGSAVNTATTGTTDLRVVRVVTDAAGERTVDQIGIDIDPATTGTFDQVAAVVDAAVKGKFGAQAAFAFDAATGSFTVSDTRSEIVDDTGVTALFGAATADAADGDGDGLVELDLSAGVDPAAAYAFTVTVGDTPVAVSVAAQAGRDTAGFVAALNAAMAEVDLPRAAVSDTAAPFVTVPLGRLVALVDDGTGALSLRATDFTDDVGYDAIAFSVSGEDLSEVITFKVESVGGSNLGAVLGFTGKNATPGDLTGEAIFEAVDKGAPRLYLDTAATGIKATFKAGVDEGLNVKLGIGPFAITVQDGKALINAGRDVDGDGQIDDAFVSLGVNDIDGDANADQYDLSDLFDLATDPARSFADLFNFDAAVGIDVDLPFSDTLGILGSGDGLQWTGSLIELADGIQNAAGKVDLSSVSLASLGDSFQGLMPALLDGADSLVPDLSGFDLNLSFDDILAHLADFNILGLLNDPAGILGGIDMILGQMQDVFDDYLADIELPIIGDAIGASVTFFEEFRYSIIAPALEFAQTPLADGSLPTTVGLLTGFLNDQLNDFLGTSGIDYIKATLNTDGALDESFIFGAINFSATVFDAALDIDFDFGIPGLDLEVEDGSEVNFKLDYLVNIGFGFDKNGFFLLNDTDQEEIEIEFTVDAGSFEGSMSVLNVLGVQAKAADLGADGRLDSAAAGKAKLTAGLTADLYAQQGLEIVAGAAGADQIQRDFTFDAGQLLEDADGNALGWERLIYVGQLDTGELVEFAFEAAVDAVISLSGQILNPITGTPIEILGRQVIPTVGAELVMSGGYDTTNGLSLDKLGFENVRLDASVLYDALIKPIIDPIKSFVDPLAKFFSFLNKTPIKFIADIVANAFPILKFPLAVSRLVASVTDFANTLSSTNGILYFGDFDFIDVSAGNTANADGILSGETSLGAIDRDDIKRTKATNDQTSGAGFGEFGDPGSILISLPLLSDPFSALGILTGNFDEVDLVTAQFSLFNLDIEDLNIVDELLDSFSAPGWVKKIINSVFEATITAKLKAQFTAGYDLSGIVNFANTFDFERLLDGVFVKSGKGSLLDAEIGATIALNAVFAGVKVGGGAKINLGFNDPNQDGKLRIPEMIALVEAGLDSGSFLDALGFIFQGEAGVNMFLNVWAGIDVGLFSLKFNKTVFKIDESIPFGGFSLPPEIGTKVENPGDTAFLNVGSAAGGSYSKIETDGDDVIVIDGPNSPIKVQLTSDGRSLQPLEIENSDNAGALIIPAGEGDNVVDMSGLTGRADGSAPIHTITYFGKGEDTIILPDQGIHVVFAGAGDDRITAGPGAQGTYVIFGEEGAETVDIAGGNVVFLGDHDHGMRDLFLATFKDGGVTEAKLLDLLGIQADGTVGTGGKYSFDSTTATRSLQAMLDAYTRESQLTAERADELVEILGTGNHLILTGKGDDTITTQAGQSGEIRIYSGAGEDTITTGGASVYGEAGAGDDLIALTAAQSTFWGWGKDAGQSGLLSLDPEDFPGQPGLSQTQIDAEHDRRSGINKLAIKDGDDIFEGGSGQDSLFGQKGSDFLSGGLGDDLLVGGLDQDFIGGGTLIAKTKVAGVETVVDIKTLDLNGTERKSIRLSVEIAADGDDVVRGGQGEDVIIGGGGGDSLRGGSGNDAIVGDFGTVDLASNLIAQGATSEAIASAFAGNDTMDGQGGDDLLVAGGGTSEVLRDLYGNNVLIGDFGRIEGARILEFAETVTALQGGANGGADSLETGRGNDLLIGGEGADTIAGGLGGDIALGDLGTIDIKGGIITSVLDVVGGVDSSQDGDDVIDMGTDQPAAYDGAPIGDLVDIVIGGGGGDAITSGLGDLNVIGDSGTVTVTAEGLSALRTYLPLGANATAEQIEDDAKAREKIDTFFASAVSLPDAADGDDSVTNDDGDVKAILGGGGDEVTLRDLGPGLAENVNYIMTDDGTITVAAVDDPQLLPTDPLVTTHTVTLTTAASLAPGTTDDTVTEVGADGQNMIVGGHGGDTMTLGDGDNLILGDGGTLTDVIVSTDDVRDPASRVIAAVSADDADDGDDAVTAGDGRNVVILGGGGDSLTAGDGGNFVLGDSGRVDVDATGVAFETISPTVGGNDSVLTGAGDDRAILGAGDDTADLGEGDNAALGDSGTLSDVAAVLDGLGNVVTPRVLTLKSDADTTGGDDSIGGGAGADVVILGAGDDLATLGDGDNAALGDSGEVGLSDGTTTLTSLADAADGNDSVGAGTGRDLAILGGGGDTAALGAGDNAALGDSGTLIATPTGTDLDVDSPTIGGDDTVTTLDGEDLIILGAGADSADSGAGRDMILGDNGRIADTAGLREATSSSDAVGGDDAVASGAGDDLVILGAGDDTALLGDGDDAALGDAGRIVEVPGLTTLTTTTPGVGGDDSVAGGAGDDRAILGAGDDTADLGEGDNAVLGDNGLLTVSPTTRVLTATDTAIGGDDSVTSGAGDDLAVLGAGDDTADLGDGDNAALGDNGSVTQTPAERLLVSASDAIGGRDAVTAGAGEDVVILGAGDDMADLGEGDNAALGDAGTARVTATVTALTSTSPEVDGDDSLTTGTGDDAAILGDGADTADLGEGDNAVLGDNGTIRVTAAGTTLDANADDVGGADSVTTGSGQDLAILGTAGDTADLGDGDNRVIGDAGRMTVRGDVSALVTTSDGVGGADSVTAGSGDDIAILGMGGDTADLGAGDNAALGDHGSISVTPDRSVLDSSSDDVGGDDTVTASGGQDLVILGTGADRASLGDGDNRVLGDSGRVTVTDAVSRLVTTSDDVGGDDSVTTGAGDDIAILGDGSDSANLGGGDNRALGDAGQARETASSSDLRTTSNTVGGDDSIVTGAGHDHVLLGAGDDTARLGDGENRALGDGGRMAGTDDGPQSIRTAFEGGDGNDAVTTGAGADVVVLGLGDDRARTGAGEDVVIGDNGAVTLKPGLDVNVVVTAETEQPGIGGDDRIATDAGRDLVLGGAGSDRILAGDGRDAVLGDDGVYVRPEPGADGELTATLLTDGGDDRIDGGAGNDLVIASLGDDSVTARDGEDAVFGDDATLTMNADRDLETFTLTNLARGGDDRISALGAGDNILVGQAGSDTVTGGDDDDMIALDLITGTLTDAEAAQPDQSAGDRMMQMTSIRPDIAGDDSAFGGSGEDFVIGGFGDDVIDGGDDQDILIGDTAIVLRTYTGSGADVTEDMTIDTNFAFEQGGFDSITGAQGPDIVIGGLGPDVFVGDTAEDLLFSDAFAGIFQAVTGGFSEPLWKRELITSNFAGTGAIDLVSNAQQDASIGAPLDFLQGEGAFADARLGVLPYEAMPTFTDPLLIERILDFFDRDAFIGSLAMLIADGVDRDVLDAAIRAALMDEFAILATTDVATYEVMLSQMIEFLLTQAALAAEAQDAAIETDVEGPLVAIAAE
ncbi:MAG: hypothetical protein ACU0BF_11585 [Paracoccaceae bacterium]